MAWTDPAGHVWAVGEVLSAGNMNTYIRLDLSDLDRRTTITSAEVLTGQSTTSTSYTDLTTAGPAVTVTIGSTGQAIVGQYCQLTSTVTANLFCTMTFAVSGATTSAADFTRSIYGSSPSTTVAESRMISHPISSLTAGSNTFTSKYAAGTGGGTANFAQRRIYVTPLGS